MVKLWFGRGAVWIYRDSLLNWFESVHNIPHFKIPHFAIPTLCSNNTFFFFTIIICGGEGGLLAKLISEFVTKLIVKGNTYV